MPPAPATPLFFILGTCCNNQDPGATIPCRRTCSRHRCGACPSAAAAGWPHVFGALWIPGMVRVLPAGPGGLMQAHIFPREMGLHSAIAIVPVLFVRVGGCGFPAALRLACIIRGLYSAWRYGIGRTKRTQNSDTDTVHQSLFFLVTSWIAWYLLLSIGWPRYLFVPVFVGILFAAVMLCDLTSGFNILAHSQVHGRHLPTPEIRT